MMPVTSQSNYRKFAGVIFVVAAITLITRVWLRMQTSGDLVSALSYMTQYFTILTNTMVLVMTLLIFIGRDISARVVRAIVVYIACVGIIYHALLAHLVSLSGIDLLADHGTHTFVPLLSVVWWWLYAPRPEVKPVDFALWVAWPLVYCVYILTRASVSNFYPYPFLNVPEVGGAGLVTNVVGLSIGFIVVGLLLTLLGKLRKI